MFKDSFNNISDSNITINLPENKVPPQLTSKLGKDSIIGREKELKEIDQLLNSSNSLLLINGIGGIGKSTIASYYLHSQKEKLDYYGFFEGIDSFINELREPLDLKQEKQQDAFMEALAKLRKLEGEKLLVIDDVKDIEENQETIERILELKNSSYKILLTSREEIEDIAKYDLDVLSMDDAKELFNSIYEVEEEVLLEEILEYLDCHAFFVEMIAKTLKSKQTLTPELIKEKFENGEFSTIKRKRKESFNDYLNELFSFDELDKELILRLKQLSVLPTTLVDLEKIVEIDEDFEDILNELENRGWLSSFDNNYKLHQIVQEYIHFNHKPLFNEIESILDYFYKPFYEDKINFQDTVEHFDRYINNISTWTVYCESIAKFLEKLDFKNEYVSNFYYTLGQCYYEKYKNYTSARKYFKLSEKLTDELKLDNIEKTYQYLGDIALALEKIEDSYKYHKLALAYYRKENDKKNIAVCFNDIGRTYWKDAKKNHRPELLKIALSYYDKALTLYEKIDEFNEISTTYNNISLVYKDKKEYEKSHEYLNKALKNNTKEMIAKFYNNKGKLYIEEKKYELAEQNILESLKISNNLSLYEYHDYFAESYDNLAFIHFKRGEYKEAKIEQDKAIEIWSYNHDDNYSYLDEARDRLVLIEKELPNE